ncbi:MAG: M14 family metallopeptidase, partial [Myxococcota bacterium]
MRILTMMLATVSVCVAAAGAAAQQDMPSKVPIAFDRYYDSKQMNEYVRAIGAAYPEIVTIKSIGASGEGREMLVAIVNPTKGGPDTTKPAMWIDGNIHGNEVQAGEVVLYTLWYLTKSYGVNERLTKLMDSTSLYLLVSVNPDGRQYWFDNANTPHSSRQNRRLIDHDLDGKVAEDGPDDLDKDGHITQMWREDPNGRWTRSQTDERVFVRLRDDQQAGPGVKTYTSLGEEGIDNDDDGKINEDPPFGDDMNRNWPSDWQPTHIQGGAGPYPVSAPEVKN